MFNRRASLITLILIVALVGFNAAATKPIYEISDTFPAKNYEKPILESADSSDESLSWEPLASWELQSGESLSKYPRLIPRILSPEALKSAVG